MPVVGPREKAHSVISKGMNGSLSREVRTTGRNGNILYSLIGTLGLSGTWEGTGGSMGRKEGEVRRTGRTKVGQKEKKGFEVQVGVEFFFKKVKPTG